MDNSEKPSKMKNKASDVDNEYSTIIRKIKNALLHYNGDFSNFTYAEIRVIRKELYKIKKSYKKFFSPSDIKNMQDIEQFLAKLKITHPHLYAKQDSLSLLTNTNDSAFCKSLKPGTVTGEQVITQEELPESNDMNKIQQVSVTIEPTVVYEESESIPMELDESLMSLNNKKPKSPVTTTIREDINTEEEKKPLVESEKKKSVEGFDVNALNPIQKLYLQALKLWECIDEYDSKKEPDKPPKTYRHILI